MYAVVTENDESQWSDDTGVLYHFPRRYAALLTPGTRVAYYKGRLTEAQYAAVRLSRQPHYFGTAVIGNVFPDRNSSKGDLFATIDEYQRFSTPVLAKDDGGRYIESIPPSRAANYWRDGVRQIQAATFLHIVTQSGSLFAGEPSPPAALLADASGDLESLEEGNPSRRYVTVYERDPRYRKQAIAIHGVACHGCGEDLGKTYGTYAQDLIHVHHVVPVSTYEAPRRIDPATELVPVCPNCHAVIHRKRSETLSIAALREMRRQAAEALNQQ